MPKYVYVQVAGTEKPARIEADKVEKRGGHAVAVLILKKGDVEVGEFKSDAVAGWWIADEHIT